MRLWYITTFFALTFLSIFYSNVPPFLYFRYLFAPLLISYLPGLMLVKIIFSKNANLDPLERLALSFGLSMVLTILIGLFLNYTPWGLNLNTVFVSLTLLTVVVSVGSLIADHARNSSNNQ